MAETIESCWEINRLNHSEGDDNFCRNDGARRPGIVRFSEFVVYEHKPTSWRVLGMRKRSKRVRRNMSDSTHFQEINSVELRPFDTSIFVSIIHCKIIWSPLQSDATASNPVCASIGYGVINDAFLSLSLIMFILTNLAFHRSLPGLFLNVGLLLFTRVLSNVATVIQRMRLNQTRFDRRHRYDVPRLRPVRKEQTRDGCDSLHRASRHFVSITVC